MTSPTKVAMEAAHAAHISVGALIAAIFTLAGAYDIQTNAAYARAHAHVRATVLDIIETRVARASWVEARIRYTPFDEDRGSVTTVILDATRPISRGDILDIAPRDWPCVDPILLPVPSPLRPMLPRLSSVSVGS